MFLIIMFLLEESFNIKNHYTIVIYFYAEFSDIFTTTSPSIIALCICTIGYVKFKQLLWSSCMYKQWVNFVIVKPDSVFGNYAHLMLTASEYCEYFWSHLLYWVHVATLLSIFRITFAFMIPQILHNNNYYKVLQFSSKCFRL